MSCGSDSSTCSDSGAFCGSSSSCSDPKAFCGSSSSSVALAATAAAIQGRFDAAAPVAAIQECSLASARDAAEAGSVPAAAICDVAVVVAGARIGHEVGDVPKTGPEIDYVMILIVK